MKRFIENYKEKFQNRGNSSYTGLKIVGLIVLLAIFVGIVVLILGETVLAADAAYYIADSIAVTPEAAQNFVPEVMNGIGG